MRKMMPIGPLMIEHRLIERMINIVRKEIKRLEKDKNANPAFVDTLIDFTRTYIDRCHHGKEEDILFRELKKKTISAEHEKIIDELIEEHKLGRKIIEKMADAHALYVKGEKESLPIIIDCMKKLIDLYPRHVEKEDKHFFLPVMKYFTEKEKDDMLREEFDYDQKLIHEIYKDVVIQWEQF